MNKQQLYCELLTLRKPTKVDDLVNSVEKPRGAVPKNGFPLWNVMKLDAKLPVLQEPKEKFVFTRDKLGHKLWRNVEGQEFTLADPYCVDISYDYDPLHDENLRPFFCRKANRDHMRELGLSTPDGDAVCSLKKFNEYRRYLKNCHVDAVNRERVVREEEASEEGRIAKAQERLDKDLAFQTKAADRLERAKEMKKKVEQDYLDRRQSWLDSQARHAMRVEAIAVHQRNETQRRRLKGQAVDQKRRDRAQQGIDIARRKKYKTLKNWHHDERERTKRLAREAREAEELKRCGELHHWEQKVKCQNSRVKRVKKIIAGYEADRAVQVEKRNLHVAAERQKLDDLLLRIKASRLRHSSEKGHLWTMPTMVRAMSIAWENEQHMMLTGFGKIDRHLVEKSLNMQIAESKNKPEGKEMLAILQATKWKLDKETRIPEPVTISIDMLLDNVVYEYTKKNVEKLIIDVAEKAINCSNQLEQVAFEEEQKKFGFVCSHTPNNRRHSANRRPGPDLSGRRVSIMVGPHETVHLPRRSSSDIPSSTKTSRSASKAGEHSRQGSVQVQRIVSFGSVSTIELPIKQESGENATFQRTRDRPPTPVPSMTELVNAVFVEPIELDRDAVNEDMEKKNLEKLFHSLGKNLLISVLTKAEKGMECTRKRLSQVHALADIPEVNLHVLIEKITDLILSDENVCLMESVEIHQVRDILVRDLLQKRRADINNTIGEVCYRRKGTDHKLEEQNKEAEQKAELQPKVEKQHSSVKDQKRKVTK